MEKIYVRITRGVQPYLYDCFAIPQDKAPVEICRNQMFGDLIVYLFYLNDAQNPDSIEDYEFARYLMYIAAQPGYTFTIKTFDSKQYMENWLNRIKD